MADEVGAGGRRFLSGLAAIALAALTLRVVYVFGWHHPAMIGGDSFYYHYGANLLADGKGFPHPYRLLRDHVTTPGAQHPPLYQVVLALPSVVGLDTFLDHQLFSCLLGTATVVVVGYAGRTIASPRAGLIAAGIAAVYPNLWFFDAEVLSETLILLTTAVTVLVAYRFFRRPSVAAAVGLGVAVGFAALTRAEAILLPVLLVAPLCLWPRRSRPDEERPPWRRRLVLLGAAWAASVVVLAPWVGYNLARFDHPVLVSSGLDPTLTVSNCPETYVGTYKGWWSFACYQRVPFPPGDESDQGIVYRKVGLDYLKAHKGELPGVTWAREGRTWGFYRPLQELTLDSIELRELPAERVGLGMYYALAAGAVAGGVVLRRRRVPLVPMVALAVNVTLAVAITFGQTRYRASAEIALVLLTAVALDAALPGRRGTDPAAEPPEPAEVAADPPLAADPAAADPPVATEPAGAGPATVVAP